MLTGYDETGATAAWQEVDEYGHLNFWASRYDSDWGNAEPIEADSGVPPDAELAMDPGGNAMVLWVHWDAITSDQNIMAKRFLIETTSWPTAGRHAREAP